MRAVAWFLKPPPWFLGATGLLGAMWFIVVTFIASPFMRPAEVTIDYDLLGRTIVIAAVAVAIPLTRGLGLGFFAAFVLGSFNNSLGTRIWWQPFRSWYAQATRPAREKQKKQEATAAWMQRYRNGPLDIADAVRLLDQLRSDCLRPPLGHDLDEVLSQASCAHHRATTQREKLEWPSRYIEGDDGWRWHYESLGESNYRIVLRPDSALQHQGPVVETTGDGLARIRDDDRSAWRVIYTPVPTLRRVRECVLAAARLAEAENNTTAKFDYLYEGWYAEHACPEFRMSSATTRENGDHVVQIKRWSPRPGERAFVDVVLFRVVGPSRFEVRRASTSRSYLLDADGGLHVTADRRLPETTDPAPARCEEDASLSCTDR